MMQGFFTKQETSSIERPDGKTVSCVSCGRYLNTKFPKPEPQGEGKLGILCVGSFPPNEAQSIYGDEITLFLRKVISYAGYVFTDDLMHVNAVRCFDKEKPTAFQVSCCRRLLLQTVKKTKPKVIILFGVEAIQSIIGHRFTKDINSIEKWRGFCIPDQELNAWICPVYSPADVLKANKPEMEYIWKQDLKKALGMHKVPFRKSKEIEIDYIEDLSPLSDIKSDSISFDYETTGLKPHAKGHRIICASVADTPDHVFAFMMPETRQERKPFTDLLKRHSLGKMAHNMKYEHAWTLNKLKVEVVNWEWDSMLAAHIIDNRPGITGLKFQVYVNFGIIDYSSEIAPYLDSESKDGNAINNIQKLVATREGQHKLLTYCAMDSVYQYRLAMLQMQKLNYQYLPF